MSKRMVEQTVWTNPNFAARSMVERLLWIGLITNADDQGRLVGHPGIVKAAVFPVDQITPAKINAGLAVYAEIGWLIRYEVKGVQYAQIVHWWEHQQMRWAAPSLYPAPEGWKDRIRYRKGDQIIIENWGTPAAPSGQTDGDAGDATQADAEQTVGGQAADGCPPDVSQMAPKRREDKISKEKNREEKRERRRAPSLSSPTRPAALAAAQSPPAIEASQSVNRDEALIPIWQAYQRGNGWPVDESIGAQDKPALRELLGEKRTPGDVEGCTKWVRSMQYWTDRVPPIATVRRYMAEWIRKKRPAQWVDSSPKPGQRRVSVWTEEELQAAREADRGREWEPPPD